MFSLWADLCAPWIPRLPRRSGGQEEARVLAAVVGGVQSPNYMQGCVLRACCFMERVRLVLPAVS